MSVLHFHIMLGFHKAALLSKIYSLLFFSYWLFCFDIIHLQNEVCRNIFFQINLIVVEIYLPHCIICFQYLKFRLTFGIFFRSSDLPSDILNFEIWKFIKFGNDPPLDVGLFLLSVLLKQTIWKLFKHLVRSFYLLLEVFKVLPHGFSKVSLFAVL